MRTAGALALLALRLMAALALYQDEPLLYGTFPDDFRWGVATAAFQVEGAWNENGKVRLRIRANEEEK